MKYNKKATSIIEAMIVLMLVVTGVVGMYKVYGNSQKLSNSTGNKIQAIQIAREGIEAMKNIRDTNWIKFGADYDNCWNSLNYNSDCVGISGPISDIPQASFVIYQSLTNNWKLDERVSPGTGFSHPTYKANFKVSTDLNTGFYTQSGSSVVDSKPLFTREIKIDYLKDDLSAGSDTDEPKMRVTSIVQWADSSSNDSHKVEFSTLLTNWKK